MVTHAIELQLCYKHLLNGKLPMEVTVGSNSWGVVSPDA